MVSLISFVVLFGIIVFVHEFGHFIVAKLSGIKVIKFSMGYGPKIIGKKWGETEYVISAFPLGGYVKMLGENPEEVVNEADKQRSFDSTKVWKRFLVVAAGPISNMLLPLLLFSIIFFVGWPEITTQIGTVIKDSPAHSAGILPGDKITKVNGKDVWEWERLSKIIQDNINRDLTLTVKRDSKDIELKLIPQPKRGRDEYGVEKDLGWAGFLAAFKKPILGIESEESVAHKLGFRHLDLILSVNDKPVRDLYEFKKEVKLANSDLLNIAVTRAEKEEKLQIQTNVLTSCLKENLSNCGIYPSELFIKEIPLTMPAGIAGVPVGARIVSINNLPVTDFNSLQEFMQENRNKPILFGYSFKGKFIQKEITPIQKESKDKLLGLSDVGWLIGIAPYLELDYIETKIDPFGYHNPFTALAHATQKTLQTIAQTAIGFIKLFSGQVSLKTLGGPIMIFQIAGASFKYGGLLLFIKIIALLSIAIGILNLLPIPLLDGGHLVFFTIEAIRKKPVPVKTREIAAQIGLAILITIMLFAFYNDIMRFFV